MFANAIEACIKQLLVRWYERFWSFQFTGHILNMGDDKRALGWHLVGWYRSFRSSAQIIIRGIEKFSGSLFSIFAIVNERCEFIVANGIFEKTFS